MTVAVATKGSKQTPLGLVLAHNEFPLKILSLADDNIFSGKLTAGMTLLRMNGQTYGSYAEGISLLQEAEGALATNALIINASAITKPTALSESKPASQVKKTKKPKDPNAPNRPRNAYEIYKSEVAPQIKAEFPGLSFGELSKVWGQMWKSLSPDQKKKYNDLAAEDKARYHSELNLYKKATWGKTQTTSSIVHDPTSAAPSTKTRTASSALPFETFSLSLPAPLGVTVMKKDSHCVVCRKYNDASHPLQVDDIIVSVNGVVLSRFEEGMKAWIPLFQKSQTLNLFVVRKNHRSTIVG